MYIAIAGNIGSGKTTLTEILTKRYAAKAYYEEKGKLKKIDGSGNVEAITALIFEALGL
jgi:adenylate kinase family enzyme